MATQLDIHPFEKSGCGVAPFRYVRMFENVYAPTGQPGGTCDHCGMGIRYCFVIRSADGREFIVGSDCVGKTYRDALVNATEFDRALLAHKRELARAQTAKRNERESARISAAIETLPRIRPLLEGQPHPRAKYGEYFAKMTLADYVDWMLCNAGHSGRFSVCKIIEGYAKQ